MSKTPSTSAERHNALVSMMLDWPEGAEMTTGSVMARVSEVAPGCTQAELTRAIKDFDARVKEKQQVDEAEVSIMRRILDFAGPDAPHDMALLDWAQVLVERGDPRGQQMIDLLNDPALPAEIEVPEAAEITTHELAERLRDAAVGLSAWFQEQVRWNREMGTGEDDDLGTGTENLCFRKKDLGQFSTGLPWLAMHLGTLTECMKAMVEEEEVAEAVKVYAATLPDAAARTAVLGFIPAFAEACAKKRSIAQLDAEVDAARAGSA